MAKVQQDTATDKGTNGRQRGWGEGTIVERAGKDGTVKFLAQVWVNGRRVAKTHATRPEAQRWIRRTLSDGERGITPTDEGKWTVAKFLESWLDAKRASLKPKSMEDYTWAVRRHLAPGLAKLKLADLRGNHLQTLYGKELAAGLSPRSVHHLHRVSTMPSMMPCCGTTCRATSPMP
jgi:hypothetical protein